MKNLLDSVFRGINNLATAERLRFYPRLVAVVAACLLVANYLLGEGYYDFSENVIGTDFLCFYTNAKIFLSGNWSGFYDLNIQAKVMEDIIPSYKGGIAALTSPPIAALIYAPFGLLSYAQALALWWVSGIIALFSSLILLMRSLQITDRSTKRFILLTPLLFFPTWLWIGYGQVSGFIFFLLTASFVLLRKGNDFAAGLVLGLLAFKPQLALPLALPIIINLRWSAIAGGAISLSLWLAVGFIIFPELMIQYWNEADRILGFNTQDDFRKWGEHTIFGFFQLLLINASETSIKVATLVASGWMMLLMVQQWRKSTWEPGTPSWDLRMSASMVAGLCLAVHLFSYDLLLLLLPFIIVFCDYKTKNNSSMLDHGILFSATIIVYIMTVFSAQLSNLQQQLFTFFGLPGFAIQLSTLSLVLIIIVGFRSADKLKAEVYSVNYDGIKFQ